MLILVIACVNYVNLTTARAVRRAKEVSVRKVVGARRYQLIRQMLIESVLMTITAFVLAIVLVEVTLPAFNAVAGFELHLPYENADFWLVMIFVALIVGVLSGGYPAFALSVFQPVDALKGTSLIHPSGAWFRKALVVFQFAVSISLMIVTVVVFSQLSYVKNKALGLEKEQVMMIEADGIHATAYAFVRGKFGRYDAFKQELLRNPNVLKVGAISALIGEYAFMRYWYVAEEGGEQMYRWETLYIDYDLIDAMGIQLKEGRTFSHAYETDLRGAVILNETAAKALGNGNVLGKSFSMKGFFARDTEVVGVVKDFHTQSLHHPIRPVVIAPFPKQADHVRYFVVKIRAENVIETVAFLRGVFQKRAPDYPFNYSFLDEDYDALYRAETQLLQIFGMFAGLAIFIACLGLIGLVSFMAERRTKEIGIRKVLGASVAHICGLLSKDFVVMVVVANLVAWPVAYYAMSTWLQNFAYRIDLTISTFLVAGAITLVIALCTVSAQAFKAACANPVESLRYE